MSDSQSGITDSVEVEHTSAEALEELVLAADPAVEEPADEPVQQRLVLNTEDAWTAQSQHGVVLNHFVPTQDYTAIENDPAERATDDGNDW